MVKNWILISLLALLPQATFSQTWDESDIKEYKIEKADIILKVYIKDTWAMTDILGLSCQILDVVKGEFTEKELNFDITYGGASRTIYDLRLKAIHPNDTVILGFRKHPWIDGIKVNGIDYAFFMSQ